MIEAAAYKRLLALDAVPGTGVPGISGRALLASLIATGILDEPPCFDRDHPRGDCGASQRLDLPLQYWPVVHSGAPDLVIDRQLGQQGQCQHFMADTADSVTPVDPRFGVPGGLVTTAYLRCIRDAGSVFDGILRDPRLATWRLVGTYVLMHAIEDSFSAAHVDRDPHFEMVHLLSWTLIDWPSYLLHGHAHFPPATHHAVSDPRDADYLRWDARAADGHACRDFHNPYAYPEACLTDRAKAAVDAVVDYLVLTYRLRARARAEGRQVSLFAPTPGEDAALWMGYVHDHLPSVSVPAELPVEPRQALPRPDVFLGAEGVAGGHTLGAGAWGAKLFVGPALPFALALTGTAGYTRSDGIGELGASASLGLLLPLIRRFTIGAAPAGLRIACDTRFGDCQPDAVATLGVLLVPLGKETWLGIEGPRWSWTTRTIGRSWIGLSFGWSDERVPRPDPPGAEAVARWDPPRPDEVRAYRHTRFDARRLPGDHRGVADRQRVRRRRAGVARDRDGWDRRAGLAPGLQVEIDGGRIEGNEPGGNVAVAPTLRAYLPPTGWP